MPELKAFLSGGGEMGELIRAHDWASTPLGPIHGWPQSLRSSLGIALRSPGASAIFWGPDHVFIYNDAWAALLGDRHPALLGRPAADAYQDVWGAIGADFAGVLADGQAVNRVDALLVRNLHGEVFDSWWTYSLLPIAGEDGRIGGILAQVRESTPYVLRARRDALMLRMAERLRLSDTPEQLLAEAFALIGEEIDASRIGYCEIDEEARTVTVVSCLVREGSRDISGVLPLRDAGDSVHEDLEAGITVRIDDVAASPRMRAPEVRERYARAAAAAILCVPIRGSEKCRAMLFAHHHLPRRWTDHEEALLGAATEHVWREISRVRAEAALKRSEERYRRIFEQANDLIITADLEQRITDCNPAAAAAIELPRDEILGRSMGDFLALGGMEQAREMLRHKLQHGGTTRHELLVVSRTGRMMSWDINSTLTVDDAGQPIGLHAIGRDVTEQRRAEERQRLLVNELNHRVKNTLAVVQGLALQSFKGDRDIASARDAFQQRLAALAAAHDLLTRESWEGATLEQLVQQALGLYNGHERRIEWSGPDVTLNPKAAVSLVMALHELSTNAAKYGALSAPEGRVALSWSLPEGDRLAIEWRERGGPEVKTPERRGFGFRMIERALAADLAGGARLDFAREGLVCRIDASLSDAAAAPRRL
jgi:PAS domain S-box-containing protein